MIKKLRNCKAYVRITEKGFCNSYELVSYEQPVAVLGVIDGCIVDVNGIEHELHGMALLINECYDCSVTTMMHVRKFIEDYIGVSLTISDIRKSLKTDNCLCGDVKVFKCEF